jgi:hypothetical protein
MVSQAKKYVPDNDGPTVLIVLRSDGQVVQKQFGPRFDTACDEVEFELNCVLTSATEPGESPEYVQGLIENMSSVLDAYSRLFADFLD